MKTMVIGFYINDKESFETDVFKMARENFNVKDNEPWGVYAMSASDEFNKLERIEDILDEVEQSFNGDDEKIEAIRKVMSL